ncbi:MAG: hypothetical protein EBX40_05565 [Gammaproteobacteria bacterium]|nr:hypothetical protein [Gammaproteobacteria bacterium]
MSGSRPGSDLSEHSFYAGDEPQTRRASIASIDSAAQSEASASYKPTLLARALNTFPLNLLSDVSRLTMAGGVGLIALGLTALVPGGQIAILGAIAVLATAAVARKAYLNYQEVKKHGFLSVTQRVENEIQPGTHGRKDDPSFWDGIKACFGLYPAALVDTGVGLSIGAGFVKAGALVTTTVSAGGGAAFVVLNALNTFMTGKKALQAGDEVDGLKKMQAALTGQNASVSDLQKAFYEAFNNKSSEIEAQCDKTKPQEVQKTLEAQKTLIVLRTASLEVRLACIRYRACCSGLCVPPDCSRSCS